MDYRHFELQDLVSEALIAVEANDYNTAAATLQKVLAWIESDWLATPSDAKPSAAERAPTTSARTHADAEDPEDDD